MQNSHKKRICIVSRSLIEGGADRVAAMQSIFLSELGYEVFIVTILNGIAYPFKGTLLNLGELKEKNDTILGRFERLLKFKKFLKSNSIDIVIDHRVRSKPFSEYIISFFVYPKNTIYMVHNYTIDKYFPPFKFLTEAIYKRSKKIVCVSKSIEHLVRKKYNFKNLQTINNPIDFEYLNNLENEKINENFTFIFWYGRFEEEQKNISLLIEAYNLSLLKERNIHLILMGNGKDKIKIENKIIDLDLGTHVRTLPFSQNPFAYVHTSLFTVISSNYEGFPMAVLESLACGTPVVSVKYNNYEDGILENGINGLLVENHNPTLLAEAFNNFVEDKKLYLRCKSNTKKSVSDFSVETIAEQWQNLIEHK